MVLLSSNNQPNARYYFKHIPSYSFSGWYSRGILPSHFVCNGITGLRHPHSLDGTFWRLHSPKLTVRPLKICQNLKGKGSSEPTSNFQMRFVSFREGISFEMDPKQSMGRLIIVYLPIHLYIYHTNKPFMWINLPYMDDMGYIYIYLELPNL